MEKGQFIKTAIAPSEFATTQAHELDLLDGASLYVLATVSSKDTALNRIETIRGVVNQLHHALSPQGFEVTFDFLVDEVKKTSSQLNMAILYIKDGKVWIVKTGNFYCVLVRSNKAYPIFSSATQYFASCSGKILPGDRYFLATNSLVSSLGEDTFLNVLVSGGFANIDTDYSKEIESFGESGELGACCVEFQGGEDQSVGASLSHHPQKTHSEHTQQDAETGSFTNEDHSTQEIKVESGGFKSPVPRQIFDRSRVVPRFNRIIGKGSDRYESRGRLHKSAIVAAALLVVLSVVLVLGGRARDAQEREKRVSESIKKSQELLSQAQVVSSLNRQKARELVYEARDNLAGLPSDQLQNPQVLAMQQSITEGLGAVGGLYEVSPESFLDVGLISSQAAADKLYLDGNFLYILSKNDGRIISVELPAKKTETVTVGGNGIIAISANSQRVFALTSNGIEEFGRQKKLASEDKYQEGTLLSAFAANLYVLDRTQNTIFRYPGNGSSFSGKQSWLAEGVSPDFSKAKSMAIDGSVWVMNEGGRIFRFLQGNPQTVRINAQTSQSALLYTDETLKDVYILDPEKKTMDVYVKTGELVATYTSESFGQALGFVVSSETKQAIVSLGGKLVSFPLGHIQN